MITRLRIGLKRIELMTIYEKFISMGAEIASTEKSDGCE